MLEANQFHYKNLQEAWEGLNEYLLNNEEKIKRGNGAVKGTQVEMYDNIVYSESHRIDKNFNFGKGLGYSDKKWSKLINNYVNYDYLDLIASEITKREKVRNPHYNYTMHFDNKYGSGKDCLISLTFSRRGRAKDPVLIFKTRASEITKRLLFDFLLIQRIGEYVYGKKQNCQVIAQIDYMYIVVECVQMYLAHYGVDNALSVHNEGKMQFSPFQQKVLKKRDFFLNTPLEKITFKVHQRAAAQVQRKEDGSPVAKVKDLFAKHLKLFSSTKLRVKDIEKLDETL